MDKKVKVMIADDSPLARKIFKDIINSEPAFEVIATANNGKIALSRAKVLKPNILILDIAMPEVDGFEVLKEIVKNKYDIKVLMISGLAGEGASLVLKALDMGALDFISKPSGKSINLIELSEVLKEKIYAIAEADVKKIKRGYKVLKPIKKHIHKVAKTSSIPKQIIVFGTSTGGPNALKDVFQDNNLPEDCAYLIVQHMPKEFTGLFAERLNQVSKILMSEAKNKEPILAGRGYIASGDSHLEVEFVNGVPYTKLFKSEKVSGHMPSIDVLFDSVARNCANNSIAIIMTGMGSDGASGIEAIHKNGGKTIAQDKKSSVVFGMNKEAIKKGAIDNVVPLEKIPNMISYFVNQKVRP